MVGCLPRISVLHYTTPYSRVRATATENMKFEAGLVIQYVYYFIYFPGYNFFFYPSHSSRLDDIKQILTFWV